MLCYILCCHMPVSTRSKNKNKKNKMESHPSDSIPSPDQVTGDPTWDRLMRLPFFHKAELAQQHMMYEKEREREMKREEELEKQKREDEKRER